MYICECLNVVYTLQAFQNISGLGKRFTKMDLIDTPDIYSTLNLNSNFTNKRKNPQFAGEAKRPKQAGATLARGDEGLRAPAG